MGKPGKGRLSVGSCPRRSPELSRNDHYSFALPARFNFAFLEGYEEVAAILDQGNLVAFPPLE